MSIHKNLILSGALTLASLLSGCDDGGSDGSSWADFGTSSSAAPTSFWGSASSSTTPDVPGGSVVLSKYTVRDPGTQNIESHTLLAPADWQKDLRVEWRPAMQLGFVNLIGAAKSADGREARFHRGEGHTWYETNMRANQPTARTGDNAMGKVWRRPPSTPAAYASEVLLPQVRPGAHRVQIVMAEEVEAVANTWRKMFAPLIRQQEQTNAMNRGMGMGSQAKTHIAVPRVRVRYEEGGRQYEEEFTFIYFGLYTSMAQSGIWFRGADWSVSDVKSVRAPAGQLDDAHPMLRTILQSARMTEKWHAMYRALMEYIAKQRRKAHQITMDGIRKRSEMIARNGDEIREIYSSIYKKENASRERLQRAWSNTMLGVDDYRMPDGTTRSLDSSYSHVYTNGSTDTVLFTNNALFEPNVGSTQEWTRLQPVAPTGSAAWR